MIQNNVKKVKLGLIGHPLGHSLSGIIHNAAMKSVGIEGEYLLFDTEPEFLIDQVKYFKSQNFLGFNVTIPFFIALCNSGLKSFGSFSEPSFPISKSFASFPNFPKFITPTSYLCHVVF